MSSAQTLPVELGVSSLLRENKTTSRGWSVLVPTDGQGRGSCSHDFVDRSRAEISVGGKQTRLARKHALDVVQLPSPVNTAYRPR